MSDAITPKRLGRFLLSAKYIKLYPHKALKLMTAMGVVVVRAEMIFHNDSIEYTAICDKFEEVPASHRVPHYDLGITENDVGEIISVICIKID